MKRTASLLLLSIALTLVSTTARAQWSGSLDASGGFGWMKGMREEVDPDGKLFPGLMLHGLASGGASVKYKGKKFQWDASVRSGFETCDSDKFKFSLDLRKEDDIKMETLFRTDKARPLNISGRTEFSWFPSSKSRYSVWFRYDHKKDHNSVDIFSISTVKGNFSDEQMLRHRNSFALGANTSNKLGNKPDRVLLSSFSASLDADTKYDQWTIFNIQKGEQTQHIHRLTPFSGIIGLNATVHARDSVFRTKHKLMLDGGVRAILSSTYDENSGATQNLETEQWVDSLRLKEDFMYVALQVEPYLAAGYRRGKFSARADYAFQIYYRSLVNETHSDKMSGTNPHVVGNSSFSWDFSPEHHLAFTNSMAVSHPGYIQICRFERTGGFADQLWRGNPDLKSSAFTTFGLTYNYNGKHFITFTTASYGRRIKEVDQYFKKEIIDGREYKVFSWENSSNSHIFSASERIGYKGRIVRANILADYKHIRRLAPKVVKKTDEWQLTADIAFNFGKGWSAGSDIHYRSDILTLHTLISSYWTLNARIQKEFRKVVLYLQGKDLLEHQQERHFVSVSEEEMWVEQIYLNRRVFLLGLNWKF